MNIEFALTSLPDASMRLRKLARWLTETEPDQAIDSLDTNLRATRESAVARQFALTFVHLLLHIRPRPPLPGGPLPLPDRQWLLPDLSIAQLIGAATSREDRFLSSLLRDAFAPPLPTDGRPLPLHPTLEKVPLGTRRERARQGNRAYLQGLLLDTTPSVVELLGANPRLLEAGAVQIASLRPTHPLALEAILLSQRWLAHEGVCEAVLRNQAISPWLSRALLPLAPRRVQVALPHLAWLEASLRMEIAGWLGVPLPEKGELERIERVQSQRVYPKVSKAEDVPIHQVDLADLDLADLDFADPPRELGANPEF